MFPSNTNVPSKGPPIKKSKLNNENPTLNSLREKSLNYKPDELFSNYSGFMAKKEETSTNDVFKKTTNLLTNLTQINLLATDNSFTCVGDEYKHIQKFKNMHKDWPLNESLVCFSYRSINSPEQQDIKAFCFDIPSFLHMFSNLDYLKEKMGKIANDLSAKWNDKNDTPDKVGKRVWDEILNIREPET